jgi:hypothetical protein
MNLYLRIEFDNLPLCCLPREAVLVVQFCVLVQNNDNISSEKCLAWASKALFNENLYVLHFVSKHNYYFFLFFEEF